MNATDIINLVNAGFTKNEIMEMFGQKPEQKETREPEQKEMEPDPKQVENTTNTTYHPENDNLVYAELIKKLDNLADSIKTSNFRTPMPFNPLDTETKADNFFANIISPKLNEEGSN